MKQQSLSEARKKIKVDAFIELFRLTVNPMIAKCHQRWNGYRVFAIDGSKMALPKDAVLAEHYGLMGSTLKSPTAQVSVLCDTLNDILVDALIEPLSYDERTLAGWHINRLEEIEPEKKKLIIFDRGYACQWLIEKLHSEGHHFVMRVKKKFNTSVDAQTSPDAFIWYGEGENRFQMRVVKFPIESGEEEALITNITDARLGAKAFKKLYYLRWPIESKYDVVKNKLNIESFSSRTVEGIRQDFFATMFLANIAAAANFDAQPIINKARESKDNKYQYHANINEAIGTLKDTLVRAFSLDDDDERNRIVNQVLEEVASYATPFRPNRSTPRKPPRHARFNHNQKVNC
jgi:hypothetical protein